MSRAPQTRFTDAKGSQAWGSILHHFSQLGANLFPSSFIVHLPMIISPDESKPCREGETEFDENAERKGERNGGM